VQQLATAVVARYGIAGTCEPLQPFSHVFTHFKLHVAPYRIRVSGRQASAAQGNHLWYRVAQLEAAPLPAPVRKLLQGVFPASDLFGGL